MPYLSQDGGDGERASGFVLNGLREAANVFDSYETRNVVESEGSDENQTVIEFTTGGTDFRLVLTKVTE